MGIKVSRIGVVGRPHDPRPKGVDAAARALLLGLISPRDTGRRATAAKAAGPPYADSIEAARGNVSLA
jgi:hypothetical protein